MFQKIMHKKWMVISLLLGNILLVAVAVSHPMYRDASLQRMLTDRFTEYVDTNGGASALIEEITDPTVIAAVGRVRKTEGPGEYQRIQNTADTLCAEMGIRERMRVVHHNLTATTAKSRINRSGRYIEKKYKVGSLQDLEDHSVVVSGRMYTETPAEDGVVEAVVTMKGFLDMDLLIGEELEFRYLKDEAGNRVVIRIVGVINSKDETDGYWQENPDTFTGEILISPELMQSMFLSKWGYEYDTAAYLLIDHTSIPYNRAGEIIEQMHALTAQNTSFGRVEEPVFVSLLTNFLADEKKVETTLSILQVPVLVLLCAFLFMISRQMLEMEQSEISLLKSRGASKGQIFRLYLMQSSFLALISFVIGLPLGSLLCRILGSASAFLEFVQRRPLQTRFTAEVLFYAVGALVLSILMTVLPAFRQSGISIVRQKQSRARGQSKRPLWQRLFLDVVILAVSLYGYYAFRGQQEDIIQTVVSGKAMDPLLFLSSGLFILGASLVCLRLQPLLVRIIYFIGKRRWKPAGYASFLEILRTGKKQYFIMTFLMLTVSLGIFNTTVARTILANAEANQKYNVGADIVLQEKWRSNEEQVRLGTEQTLIYKEPDFDRYGQIEGVKSAAKVYINKEITLPREKMAVMMTSTPQLYAIHSKNFGTTTSLPDDIMSEHYYTILNKLGANPDAVLLSSAFRDILGLKVGDTFVYRGKDAAGRSYPDISAKIAGFFEYFPSFHKQYAWVSADGNLTVHPGYLIIANLSTVQRQWEVAPYQIWLDVDSTDGLYRFAEENQITYTSFEDINMKLSDIKRDTLFEGTNGILTMSFIVILVLCAVGYLIYWILSIRSRELLFGIFRAMGMSRGEIIRMLLNEQMFSSLLSIVCGAGIGILASRMFVPMIQTAYSAADQVLPMQLITQSSDMIRLFGIIGIMLVICLAILAKQVFKMKIAQALKLGED